jgi:CRISPR-associated protein Csb2
VVREVEIEHQLAIGERPEICALHLVDEVTPAPVGLIATGTVAKWQEQATAVALDRNPGDLHDANPAKRQQAFDAAVASVRASVLAQGLPDPIEIDVVRSCVVPGTAKPLNYPRFPISTDRPQRVLVHVRLLFAEPVAGPVVLGAGRFHGLGLLLPVDDRAALEVST